MSQETLIALATGFGVVVLIAASIVVLIVAMATWWFGPKLAGGHTWYDIAFPLGWILGGLDGVAFAERERQAESKAN
jgi:hypothetical protein